MSLLRIIYTFLLFLTFSFSFSVPGYAQLMVTETYCSTDVPVDIIDVNTVTSDLIVPDAGKIQDVVVKLQINHLWIGDLEVDLTSPESTTIDLFTDIDGSADDFGTTCVPMPDFILDDTAATPVTSYTGFSGGTFSPEDPLSTFFGEGQAGQWTLSIFDDAGGDSGTLNCWCLEITRVQSQGCCVVGVGNCLITGQDECSAEGGDYQGDGTSCDDSICSVRPIPTMGEWGMIALTVALGASAVIYLTLRRRRQSV